VDNPNPGVQKICNAFALSEIVRGIAQVIKRELVQSRLA
jgi:hypothetical protein